MPSLDRSPGETLNFTGRRGNSPINVPVEQFLPLIFNVWFFCRRPIQRSRPAAGAVGTTWAAAATRAEFSGVGAYAEAGGGVGAGGRCCPGAKFSGMSSECASKVAESA